MSTDRPKLPRGALELNGFGLFNAASYTVMMGAPVALFAKSIGATSTVLGVIVAFTPLLVIFQIPAARFLPIFGYKRFMITGWALRNLFIFLVAAVPLLTFLDDTSRLAILLGLLFLFNLLRGISSCATYPWITHVIPHEARGRFLARDTFFVQIGCLSSLLVSSFLMRGRVDPWEYMAVFLFAGIGQVLSIVFLSLVPDARADEETARSAAHVPWKAMITYGPFTRLLCFNLLWYGAVSGFSFFTVEYMEAFAGFDPSVILFLSSFAFVAAILSVPFTTTLIDRLSARALLRVAILVILAAIAGWFLIAARVIPPSRSLVGALTMLTGFGGAVFNVTNARVIMATMPKMGRNHFFALYSVIASLGMAAAPVAWGMLLDAIGDFEIVGTLFFWGRHTFYFGGIGFLLFVSFVVARILKEGRDVEADEALLVARIDRMNRPFPR